MKPARLHAAFSLWLNATCLSVVVPVSESTGWRPEAGTQSQLWSKCIPSLAVPAQKRLQGFPRTQGASEHPSICSKSEAAMTNNCGTLCARVSTESREKEETGTHTGVWSIVY